MIALDRWALKDFDPGQGDPEAGGEGWLPVSAPGDTYQALIAAGRLAHPFVGRHEAEAAWVRDREWWWRTTFEAPIARPGEATELVFEGLDTFATLYLDGQEIARTDNMFRRYAFDISDRAGDGTTHSLAIRFDPPTVVHPTVTLPVWTAFTDRVSRSRRNQMRKAQFGWGWDWGPDLPTVGVWQPARVQTRPNSRLIGTRFETLSISDTLAEARLSVELEGAADTSLRIQLSDPDGALVFEHTGPAGDLSDIAISIPSPRLWWTADLGEQPLYTLDTALMDGDRTLDQRRERVGLRTIAIDQSPDPAEPGTTLFRFVLNGVPIFAKGACWVPSTSFVADVDEATYRRLMQQSVDANMNMIRVWGGGIYEPDLFYDLCDQLGLLVWQDFMFACAQYPEDDAFQANLSGEITDQVRRLRNHACLAVWCGNNENQAIHRINDDKNGIVSPLSGQTLYDELMPTLLARLDPATPYWPSSPWGGPNPNSMRAGDVHNWTVWHGIPLIPDAEMVGEFRTDPAGMAYTRYAEDHSKFVSEFGIQAAPVMATLTRWMDAADLDPASEGFHQRIKDEARKAEAMMATVTGQPTSLQDYIDFTQWTQAEGLKFGIEHFRRRRPSCSGALLWQLNDCWPCVSWSLIDWGGAEKAAYHAVRRAFAPVLASFRSGADGQVELWISNDTLAPVAGEVMVSLEALDGTVIDQWTVPFDAPVGGHAQPWSQAIAPERDRVLRARSRTEQFEPARYLFVPISQLALGGARPHVQIEQMGPNALRIDVSVATYLPFVHLVTDRTDVRFDDNYFDLFAGQPRSIRVEAGAALSVEDLGLAWWPAPGEARGPRPLSTLVCEPA